MEPIPGPPETPQPPLPLVEAPDFRSTGAALAAGAKEGNFWESLWEGLSKWIPKILGAAFGFLVGAVAEFANGVVRLFILGKPTSKPSMDALMASITEEVLGEVDAGTGRQRESAAHIGRTILGSLFPGSQSGACGQLDPSSEAAAKYLETILHMNLALWLEGMLADAFTLHELEQFGDLKKLLADSLGLGRLTRRVLAPPLKVLIEEPFTWLLNKTYCPTLLSPGEAVEALNRGSLTAEEFREQLARHGYTDERMKILVEQHEKHLSLADLDYLVSHQMMSQEDAVQELVKEGWDVTHATVLLKLEADKRLDSYRHELAAQAVEHFANRDIEADQFFSIIESTAIPAREREMLRRVAAVRRELRVTLLSIGEMEDMVVKGIQGRDDLRRLLQRKGYSSTDALHLELLLIDKVKDQIEAQKLREDARQRAEQDRLARDAERKKREEEAKARAALGGLNLAEEQDLVRRGIRSIDQYRAFLLKLKFSAAAADDLVDLLAGEIADRAEAEQRREELRAQAAIKHIDLGREEKAVLSGVLSIDDYARLLEQHGFAAADRALMVRLLQSDLERQAQEKARKEAAAEKAAAQRLSIAEWERAVRLGVRKQEDFTAELGRREFSLAERQVLLDSLSAELAADAMARKKRAEAEARAADKQVSLADQEKSFREGVITESQFTAVLAGMGFDPDEQAMLVRLVKLDIARDQAVALERKRAQEKLAQKQIGLADLERAVMLGVVPVDAYQAELEREGFDRTSVNVLVLSLVARLQAAEEARQAREEAQKRAAQKGLDLAAIASLYRRGLIPAVDFETRLLAAGFTADAVRQLRRLADDEIAQRKAEEARRKQIAAELRMKGLSLGQFERAVKAELKTLAQYRAFLQGEGYSEADADLLVDLLENAIEAAAAKPARGTNSGV